MKHIKITLGLLMIALFVAGCVPTGPTVVTGPDEDDVVVELPGNEEPVEVQASGIKKFSSAKEILDYLEKAGTSSNYYGYSRGMVAVGVDFAMEEMAVADSGMAKSMTAPSASPQDGGGATDYSTTNVQVEGVDEADIVKNDGKYIYMVNQDRLVIVDAFPAEDAEIVYEDELPGRPRNLFVNDDRLAVFVEDDNEVYGIQPYDFMPRPRYVQETRVLVYDISERDNPELVKDYTLTGNYFESRMIGDYVYFIVKDNVYYYNKYIDLPMIRESGSVLVRPDIYYFDNPESNYVFHTISSFNINDDNEDINSKSYMMGYSDTLYVSEDNIYIAYQKNLPWSYQETYNEDRFFEVVVPLLPAYEQQEIRKIKNSKDESYEKWMRISEVMQEMYDEMDKRQSEDLIDEINSAIEDYEVKKEIDRRKTVIHKVNIDKGKITYDTSGEVSGYLLNQFSLDEHRGDLRVATTTYTYTSRQSSMHNNVYVLDDGMDIIGKIEGIAPEENIYSTRFIGNRLYMVTFKRIDPFFVIDLSNPKKPEILGKLKIPGYSDYLHPYDENHIIGIGKETGTNEWGGTSVKGVKLALFDVSDVNNPKQIDKYEIGDSGTDSEALSDHKAFLFDKEKNILVIPVREVKEQRVYDSYLGYYRDRVWQGAYVFGLTPEDGFELKGRISHQEGYEQYYYYYSGNAVRRALYMDDVLYTVSGKKILANDLEGDLEEIAEIDLPFDKDTRWYWY